MKKRRRKTMAGGEEFLIQWGTGTSPLLVQPGGRSFDCGGGKEEMPWGVETFSPSMIYCATVSAIQSTAVGVARRSADNPPPLTMRRGRSSSSNANCTRIPTNGLNAVLVVCGGAGGWVARREGERAHDVVDGN